MGQISFNTQITYGSKLQENPKDSNTWKSFNPTVNIMFCSHNSVQAQIIDIPAQILPVQIRHGENWALKDK